MSEQDSPYVNYAFNKGYTPDGYAEKVYHLHVRYSGDWGELYFCDYLKNHLDEAKLYAALKTELSVQYRNNRDAYTAAKSEFIKKHTAVARAIYKNKYKPKQRP